MLFISNTDTQLPSDVPHGLERYTDRHEIARGGNGLLESGFDVIIGRTVVIKTLLPEYRLDRKHRRRLLREARVTAQLPHPVTVPVYEIGEDRNDGIFYTMKRISGENFFDVIRKIAQKNESTIQAYPTKRRLEVLHDVCHALSFAHARGVIHRDVKPENIYVGNFGEVTLLDWGSAKVWGQSYYDQAEPNPDRKPIRSSQTEPEEPVQHGEEPFRMEALTPAQQVIGTPTYMSPEQIANRNVDERSDVFSAGVCLYEALAIAEPFRGVDQSDTFDNICSRSPTPPSERSPERDIPKLADAIFARATAKQVAARYQTMREFNEELEKLIALY
ncbi:serine/threonine protein kinase [Rubripirellula amarantea]|uniref:Serine/threonine-protein kinase PknD n=1 Tax=Rubripirellula amarantea TaxID=2527999 RepID=A0A5C5WIV5_9BACT|nr:serine/threonine-protein kinase [Rubripirellula amarantea]MDA8745919.1 serine/threonine protein kinase [Rubripirellula amarantea]TWT50678.1 Serine/threonine-protein kinase PknD [Rubripirellula amarantea]